MSILLLIDFLILLFLKFFIKIFITVFSWAADIFFGEFSEKMKVWFYLIIVLSFVWLFLILAKFFPGMLGIFNGYIPEERMFSKVMEQVIYIFFIIVIPLGVGGIAARFDEGCKKNKYQHIKWLVKGYRYAVRLGVTMVLMLICTPVIRIKRMIRRIYVSDMTMGISGNSFMYVMDEISKVLRKEGINVIKKEPPKMYMLPIMSADAIIKEIFHVESYRDLCLSGDNVSIYINSYSIMIEGEKNKIERVKMAIAKGFVQNRIYLTKSKIAQEMEDGIYNVYLMLENSICNEQELKNITDKIIEFGEVGTEGSMAYEDWAALSIKVKEIQNIILQEYMK